MTDQQWNKLLDETPYDWELRTAYAAWLQDEHDEDSYRLKASFQMYLVNNKLAPTKYHDDTWYWCWVHEDERHLYPWFNLLDREWAKKYMPDEIWCYESRESAEAVLFNAYLLSS